MLLFIRQIHTSVVRIGVKNYYQVLGVSKDASSKEIRAAFIRLSKELHPDVNKLTPKQSNVSFVDINEAHSVLSNPVTRREYDMRRGPLIYHYPASHAYRPGPRTHHFYGPQQNTYYYNEERRFSNATVAGLLCLFIVMGGVLQFFRISGFMKTQRAAAERSRQQYMLYALDKEKAQRKKNT